MQHVRPRRRAVLTAALAVTAAAAGCSVPEPRRSAPTADPAPGKPIASARARRALLMQFAAHPDDDLYFMNPDAQRLFDAGVPLVSVYVTAGEHTGVNRIAGMPGTPPDRAAYSAARHQGLRQSYAAALGLPLFTPWKRGTLALPGGRRAEVDVLAHDGRRVELVFLNLPMHTPAGTRPCPRSGRTAPWSCAPTCRPAPRHPGRHLRLRRPGRRPRRAARPLPAHGGAHPGPRPGRPAQRRGHPAARLRAARLRRPRGPHGGRLLHLGGAVPPGLGRGPGRRADTGVHHDGLPRLLQPALAQEPPAGGPEGEGGPARPVRRRPLLAVREPLGLRRLRRRRRPPADQPQGLGPLHPPPLARRPPGPRRGAGRPARGVRGPGPARGPLARVGARRCLGRAGGPRRRPARPGARLRGPARRAGAAPRCGSPRSTGTAAPTGARWCSSNSAPRRPVPRLAGPGEPGARGRPGRRLGSPAAVAAPDGRVHLFVRNADKRLSTRVRAADGSWGPWRTLPGAEEVQDGPAVSVDAAGRVHVYAAGRESVRHWWTDGSGRSGCRSPAPRWRARTASCSTGPRRTRGCSARPATPVSTGTGRWSPRGRRRSARSCSARTRAAARWCGPAAGPGSVRRRAGGGPGRAAPGGAGRDRGGARCGRTPVELAAVAEPTALGTRGPRRRPREREEAPHLSVRGLPLTARRLLRVTRSVQDQAVILTTWPAPTVRPPSRMANFRPSSMAMGWISSTLMAVLSPGMTISVPSGRVTTPVTSVVRK